MLFSVIIPVYKVEKYIDECVQSVLNQSFTDFEIILVDDGSPDNCPGICDNYAKKDTRIKVIHKENGGLSSARNSGIKIAKGDYITFLDSDDYFCDKDIFLKISNYVTNKSDDIIVCDYKRDINDTSKLYSDKIVNENNAQTVIINMVKENCFLENACAKFYKRKLLNDNKLFFVEGILHEDTEWIFRLCLVVKTIKVLNEKFYYYRDNQNSIMNNIKEKNVQDLLWTLETHIESVLNEKLNSKFKKALLSSLALVYYNWLSFIAVIECDSKIQYINKARKLKHITKYSTNLKALKHKILFNILGLEQYINLRKKTH